MTFCKQTLTETLIVSVAYRLRDYAVLIKASVRGRASVILVPSSSCYGDVWVKHTYIMLLFALFMRSLSNYASHYAMLNTGEFSMV